METEHVTAEIHVDEESTLNAQYDELVYASLLAGMFWIQVPTEAFDWMVRKYVRHAVHSVWSSKCLCGGRWWESYQNNYLLILRRLLGLAFLCRSCAILLSNKLCAYAYGFKRCACANHFWKNTAQNASAKRIRRIIGTYAHSSFVACAWTKNRLVLNAPKWVVEHALHFHNFELSAPILDWLLDWIDHAHVNRKKLSISYQQNSKVCNKAAAHYVDFISNVSPRFGAQVAPVFGVN